MYQVSNAFLLAAKEKHQEHRIQGTIGSYSFDKSNIVSGSFHITNQCTDTSDVVLGSVYMGQLEATFTGLNISYTNWVGKTITPTFGLKIGANTWEDVPLGVYRVIEAKHTAEGVAVVAYDNMRKFDRKFKKSHFRFSGTILEFIAIACSDCNVALGMTDEEIEDLPNGDETMQIFGVDGKFKDFANDIETYRDFIYWVAQTLGCFATIDRIGQLVFRKYTGVVIDEINQSHRLSGAEFADYITNYTGIYVNNMRYGTDSYYGYDVTLLSAEINLVETQITTVSSQLVQNAVDLAELEEQYAQGQITEQEYIEQKATLTAQKKSLTKQKKQLQKRLNWLEKALAKAQAGDDGTWMELGDNPFLQAESATPRERERRAVLGALDAISYTPFSCSSVMGVHYDLGDVLYFTGGHAGEDGVFCCLMMYDWTFNGTYAMQGFGADPSIANIKDRLKKTADMANQNALLAKEISSGTDTPASDDGKENDIYIKYATKTTKISKYPIAYNGGFSGDYTPTEPYGFYPFNDSMLQPVSIEWDNDGGAFNMVCDGLAYWIPYQPNDSSYWPAVYGNPYIEVGITDAGIYHWHCKVKYATNGYDDGLLGFVIGQAPNVGYMPNLVNIPADSVSANNTYFNIGTEHGTVYEYDGELEIKYSLLTDNKLYVYIIRSRVLPEFPSQSQATGRIEFTEFYFEKIDPDTQEGDHGYTENTEQYIDKIFVKAEDPQTETLVWKEIEYLSSADESTHSGLSVDYKKKVSLTAEVMRAWFKADPPQVKRTFNQYCVRYTGKPDTNIEISLQSNTGWLNKSIKQDSEGVFTIKSGGTVSSGAIEYCAYKITGLTNGQRYYFNFKCNFKDGTTFGKDYTKGLGLVFNTTGIINTDDWIGDPDTFDETNLYYSMRRSSVGNFADFSFVATATTMYMCVVVADITNGQTSSLTLSKMVVSKTQREFVRDFYIFDTVANDWLPYKPFGTGADSGGDSGASSLADLDDVNLKNLANGQILYYDAETGEWVNGNGYSLPIASANTLGGIKVGNRLSIDENGVLSANDQSYTLPKASANTLGGIKVGNGLSIDNDGVLSATGGGGASALDDLTDVEITNPSSGQVLKYDAQNEEWINADEAGGTTSVELTYAQYQALTPEQKSDPTKVYYVTDYPASGIAVDDLTDVDLTNISDGQILKWNATSQKWQNANESGGGNGGGYATFRQNFSCNVNSTDANKEIYCQIQKNGYINDGSGSSNYYDFSNCTIIPTFFAVSGLEYNNVGLIDSDEMKESYTLQDVNITSNFIGVTLYIHNTGALNVDKIYLKVGFVYFGTPTLIS